MNKPLPERLHKVAELAEYLGASVPTVYRLIRQKKVRACKIGGQWRVADEALRDFLEDGINTKVGARTNE